MTKNMKQIQTKKYNRRITKEKEDDKEEKE